MKTTPKSGKPLTFGTPTLTSEALAGAPLAPVIPAASGTALSWGTGQKKSDSQEQRFRVWD